MRKLVFVNLLLFTNLIYSQEKSNHKEGILTTVTNESIAFKDLTWDKNGKAHYLNARNKQMEDLYDNSIKEIEEVSATDPRFLTLADEIPVAQNTPKAKNDGLYRPDYPEGIYVTKEDFISKKPNRQEYLTKRGLIGFEKQLVDDKEPACFFFDNNDKKLKNIFAVVYHGILYFNIAGILNNRNKTDRAQDSDFPNSFVRVINGGANYLYTEADLANAWAKGLAYGSGGAVGGVIAGTLNNGKGIVWDYKNQEFNIFKNCKDYNDFIKDIYPKGIQTCPNQQPNNVDVRKAIEIIK